MMAGRDTFTTQEQNGYAVFRKSCASCHAEPLFTNGTFQNNGLPVDTLLNDAGRMRVTGEAKDAYTFKVPTLRNIQYTYPYMHDGRFKKLSEVISHYTSGIVHSGTLAPQLQTPISLSDHEKVDLISFLLTLSDSSFVFNKQHQYPGPFF
jgi:cytochrome c peroxidase